MTETATITRPASSPRVLSFSPEHSLGRVFVRTSGDPDAGWERLGEARWDVLVPEGMEVRLWGDPDTTAGHLDPLGGLAGDALAEIILLDCPVADDDLRHLAGLHTLRLLDLFRTRVTDDGVVPVASLSLLEWLSCTGTRVGDGGVEHLAALPLLRRLSLKDTAITDASATALAALPSLHWLSVSDTRISDAGLRTLATSPSLRMLSVARTAVTADGLTTLELARPDIVLFDH